MQKTIADQQLALQALLERLSLEKTRIQNTAVNERAVSVTTSTTVVASTTEAAPAQPQAPSGEQRLAKVEEQALKIGPLRLSGGFRLRYDGIFRSASAPADPPLTHVQKYRVRYG